MVTIRSSVSLISLPVRLASTNQRLDTANSLRAIETTCRCIHRVAALDRGCARLELQKNRPAQKVSDTRQYSRGELAPGAFRSNDVKVRFPDTSRRRLRTIRRARALGESLIMP